MLMRISFYLEISPITSIIVTLNRLSSNIYLVARIVTLSCTVTLLVCIDLCEHICEVNVRPGCLP